MIIATQQHADASFVVRGTARPAQILVLAAAGEAVIELEGERGGQHGHNYFRTNPAVAGDVVLAVRYGRPPGAEHERPLEYRDAIFWKIGDDYRRSLESN